MNLTDIGQFFTDNSEGLSKQFDVEGIKEAVELVKLQSPKNGDMIVSAGVSSSGGTITIRKIKEISEYSDWKQYGDRLGFTYEERSVLIESPIYKSGHVEPYNRQGIFYLPKRHSDMKADIVEGWTLRTNKKDSGDCRVNMEIRDFYYNNYWNTVEFNVITSENLVNSLLSKIQDYCEFPLGLKLLIYSEMNS